MNQIKHLASALFLFAQLVFTGCHPKSTPAAPISDGTIVLLRNGITNAAFVVTKQSGSPEVVDFIWVFRCDGKNTFDPKDSACVTGFVSNAKSITFGSFDIGWSTAGSSGGYVYYPSPYRHVKMPWGKYWAFKVLNSPEMAVTSERDLTKINMNDPRWKFKN